MKKLLLIAAALSISNMAFSNMANANLVQNGSFEATSILNGSWSVHNSLPNWSTVSGAGIELRNNVVGQASDGVKFVELDSHNNSAMQQTINTVLGQSYQLLFDYSPRINQAANTNGISVFWNGLLLNDITANGGSANFWSTQKFWVTGTGKDVLKFAATGKSDSLGGNIDNVQLNAVPLPAAAWLFGSALLGFVSLSNRRKM